MKLFYLTATKPHWSYRLFVDPGDGLTRDPRSAGRFTEDGIPYDRLRQKWPGYEWEAVEIVTNRFLSYSECQALGRKTCKSGKDGDCNAADCPQERDGEPAKTGRHCPLDWDREQDYH